LGRKSDFENNSGHDEHVSKTDEDIKDTVAETGEMPF
jgi:hypothetical protein